MTDEAVTCNSLVTELGILFFPHCEMPFGTGKKLQQTNTKTTKKKLEKLATFSKAFKLISIHISRSFVPSHESSTFIFPRYTNCWKLPDTDLLKWEVSLLSKRLELLLLSFLVDRHAECHGNSTAAQQRHPVVFKR